MKTKGSRVVINSNFEGDYSRVWVGCEGRITEYLEDDWIIVEFNIDGDYAEIAVTLDEIDSAEYSEMELHEIIERFDKAISTGEFPADLTRAVAEWLWQLKDLLN